MKSKKYDVPTITKAINIIDYVKKKKEASLNEILSDLGYAKSTTYQILQTLRRHDVLSRTDSGKYRLGMKCFTWGHAISRNIDIRRVSHDILRELAVTTGVSAHLAIRIGETRATFVEKIDGALYTVHNTVIGEDIVWQCSACGKVLFAWADEESQKNILKTISYKPYTQNSVLCEEDFLKSISLAKDRGYALDAMEWTDNVYGVGVPVFDHKGNAIAAISCAILASELHRKEIEEYVKNLNEASSKITRKLGG
ncbi:MAG: IclR family transcriptional regulator [Acetivibrionales bacterium]